MESSAAYAVSCPALILNAKDESDARVEFMQALAEDPSLIHVGPAPDDTLDPVGDDAFGI